MALSAYSLFSVQVAHICTRKDVYISIYYSPPERRAKPHSKPDRTNTLLPNVPNIHSSPTPSSHSHPLLPPPSKPRLLPLPPIPLRQPLTRLHQLNNINPLLERHDGEARDREDPGDGTVHLVRARHLHRRGGEGGGEEQRGRGAEGPGGRGQVAGETAVCGEQGGGDERAAEAEEVEGDEEEFVEGAGDEEDGLGGWGLARWLCVPACVRVLDCEAVWFTYLIRIIQIHNPAPTRTNILMALALPAHAQRAVHVQVMAREVQTDQQLEDHAVRGLGGREEDEQAGGRAPVGHHVEDGAEARALRELARGPAVQGVEEAGDGVQEAAAARVDGHEVEGCYGEDDAGVA